MKMMRTSMDEAAARDVHHISHRRRGELGVIVGMLASLVAWFAYVRSDDLTLPIGMAMILILLIGIAVGLSVHLLVARRRNRLIAARRAAERELREAETQRQLKEMRYGRPGRKLSRQ